MAFRWTRFWRDDRGAVAPTVALSVVGLVAAGGIAFDYAHLASLDTELQNAADQAALAAAGQLDGTSGACARAAAAASNLLTNNTLFASGATSAVTVANESTCDATGDIRFYQSYDDATDTFGDAATADTNARVVSVKVGGRTANFALTPIVGALSSGTISAQAAASLSSAICNVPPLMVCMPGTGSSFPSASDIGKGIRLQPGPQNGAWAPGDYGYLDFANGASGLATNLGQNNQAAGCTNNSTGIPTEPGNKASVTDALNSRFDLYPSSASSCVSGTGDFCPAQNARKDLSVTEEVEISQDRTLAPPGNPGCGDPRAVVQGSDKDTGTDTGGFKQDAAVTGFTRDNCHKTNSCPSNNSNYGNGTWDRAAYFAALHPGQLDAAAAWAGKTAATITRYDVYRWELADKTTRMASTFTDLSNYDPTSNKYYRKDTGQTSRYTFRNRCTYAQPKNAPPGVAAGANQKDRRVLTVAAVDCTGLNGKGNVAVKGWIDMFLVEPSLTRTSPYATGKEQIYAEIIGVAKKADGTSAYQYYLKQRPRLIR